MFTSTAHAGAFEKAGRGIMNLAFGWTELFIEPGKRFEKDHNVPEGATGIGVGLVKGLARTMAGAYELITFPIPIPEDYDSIIAPPYPWTNSMAHMSRDEIEDLTPASER